MQRHPAKPRILHMDFLRVRSDQKLVMNVPLHFIGEEKAPGLKEGGVFSHNMNNVEVSCLPADLPEFIEVDVSKMALNDVLHLSNLVLPKGVEILALSQGDEAHDSSVVSLHVPRVIEETVEAAPAEEGAEGEEKSASPDQESEGKE